MINNTCICNQCGISSFKTNQAYQRHLQTNKHKMRQENKRDDLFQCNQCNKWYCGKSGLSHHKSVCTESIKPIPEEPQHIVPIYNILLQQIAEMKDAFDQERREMKQKIETIEKEIKSQYTVREKRNKKT